MLVAWGVVTTQHSVDVQQMVDGTPAMTAVSFRQGRLMGRQEQHTCSCTDGRTAEHDYTPSLACVTDSVWQCHQAYICVSLPKFCAIKGKMQAIPISVGLYLQSVM